MDLIEAELRMSVEADLADQAWPDPLGDVERWAKAFEETSGQKATHIAVPGGEPVDLDAWRAAVSERLRGDVQTPS
jgi:hypothetical protein